MKSVAAKPLAATGRLRWPNGYGLVRLDETDSTNDEVFRQAAKGVTAPAWVTAERQTGGRGRRGNVWQSDPGNLFSSLMIRPYPARFAQLSFVAALAASDALAGFATGAEFRVKWPNDVLANGRKIVGILLEVAPAVPDVLAIGIGINLMSAPPRTAYGATFLAALGKTVQASDALTALAEAWAGWYGRWQADGFAPVRDAWLARAAGVGETVTVHLATGSRSGLFAGIDDSGALLLASCGATHSISAGDVFFPLRM